MFCIMALSSFVGAIYPQLFYFVRKSKRWGCLPKLLGRQTLTLTVSFWIFDEQNETSVRVIGHNLWPIKKPSLPIMES